MKIAYIIFDGITLLDFIGIYDPISRLKSQNYLPGLEWDVCSYTNNVTDNFGLQIPSTIIKPNLSKYDALIIPGGFGTRKLIHDNEFLRWISTGSQCKYKISVCTGSLILGAAGFLKNRFATTHFNEYQTLKPFCKTVSKDRIVVDNDVITAGAVSASIDLGLYLCRIWAGKHAENKIKTDMNYKN
jgi:cyclohexyl-isocyanide hydratase